MIRPYTVENYVVERNIIDAKDSQGKLLWRFKTGADITFSKAMDFDNDTRKEILVGTGFTETDENGWKKRGLDNGKIYIINENGKPLLKRDIGKKTIYPGGSSQWIIYDLQILDIDHDTENDILVFATTSDSADCILFIQTKTGVTLNFWHTGMITTIYTPDLGEEPILLCGGMNSRTGDKPVVFALKIDTYNDQSPPWDGELQKRVDGLLWYRFLPGGGTVRKIEEDSMRLVVETEMGFKKTLLWNGIEFSEEDTTEEMVKERGDLYFDTFDSFKEAMELKKEKSIAASLVSLNAIINKVGDDKAFNSVLLYLKGMMHYTEKRWKSSTIAFSNATKVDPKFYGAFSMLGEVYSEREQFNSAITSFNKAYNQSGKEKYYYEVIDSYNALGNFRKAKSRLLSFEKKAKNKMLYLYWSGHTAREDGDFSTAATSFEKMILLEPKVLSPYILLADILADMNKNIEKADSIFTFVIKKDTTLYNENIETEAWILYRKSQFEKAFEKIEKAIHREEARAETSVESRRKLPRLYYRKAIISQPLGKKSEKETAVKKARSSRFSKGYIKRQLDYLMGSP
jgi:tetratricopeptide (TPR) repeat protein